MHREYHKWWSERLRRDMELLIFGHAGARVLVFPTRSGRFYDYENWGLVSALREHLERGWLQLYCVDSVDAESLYAFWRPPHERIMRHVEYERYILEEVVPMSVRINSSPYLFAHGCSLGAFHAINLAFRHPFLFHKVVALSGRYDLTIPAGRFRSLFDDYYDQTIYYHTPCHFIPQMQDQYLLDALRRMTITIVIGEEDAFLESNLRLSGSLREKFIPHELHLWPGEAHRAEHWRKMVVEYL
ncbi:MAG: esterase family protein [Roseiflexaceae bacterium]